ncbi:MAG: aminotransferase class IV [Reichenbachiella sp.]
MLQEFNSKNKDIQIWVGDCLYPRNEAKVSVFDSSVQGGDAIWEGLRVYRDGVFCLKKHLDRLYESAKALDFKDIPPENEIRQAIKATLQANGMNEDAHIRLTLTRGEKVTSGMDPRLNQIGSCLIVLAEWKPLVYDNENGIRVITSTQRRNNPQFLDSKIHHANLLNNILAKIQANYARVDAAVMLDHNGFVSELNDTNLFLIKNGVIFTPHADACLHGITRGLVIDIGRNLGYDVIEKNLSLVDFYNADEVFASGTMGELTPLNEIDGRKIENSSDKNIRVQLQKEFHLLIPSLSEKI